MSARKAQSSARALISAGREEAVEASISIAAALLGLASPSLEAPDGEGGIKPP
jgi:hypothetical protein